MTLSFRSIKEKIKSLIKAPDMKSHWDAAVDVPEGWSGDQYFTTEQNGHNIRYATAPAIGEHRGTVVLTHGYGEHIDIYREAIKFYQEQGFEVFAMDWDGHGYSRDTNDKNARPQESDLDRHHKDLEDFIDQVVEPRRSQNGPLIASTHSMGGAYLMDYMQRNPETFDGAVFSAPMWGIYRGVLPKSLVGSIFKIASFNPGEFAKPVFDWAEEHVPSFLKSTVRGAFNFASSLSLDNVQAPRLETLRKRLNRNPAISYKELSHLPPSERREDVRQIREQMLDAQIMSPTFGWINSALSFTDRIMRPENLSRINVPILVGSAGNDDMVDNDAHVRVDHLVGSARVINLPSASHSLWQESDKNFSTWTNNIRSLLDEVVETHGTDYDNDNIHLTNHGDKLPNVSPAAFRPGRTHDGMTGGIRIGA